MKFLKLDRFLFYFLPLAIISGPFVADLFCILIGIFFLSKSIINKNFYYFTNRFSIFFFIWSFFFIISSYFSNYFFFSLESSLFYFRYGLFFLGIWMILDEDINYLKIFYYILNFGITFLIVDTIIQYFFGYNLFGFPISNTSRISGIYREEFVLGSMISRLFPIYIGLSFFYYNSINRYLFCFNSIILMPVLLIIGERAALLLGLLTIFILIIILISRFKLKYILVLLICVLSFIFLIFQDNRIKSRIFDQTLNQIITQDTKKITIPVEHLRLFKTGLKMFYDKPIIGHGPKTYRVACNEDKYKMKLHDNLTNCNTHPHNTYIQMLAETGIIGTLPIILMLIYTISKIVKNYIIIFNKNYDNYNLLELFVFIALLLTLWPLISTGSFFNNWINVTYYLPLGFILYLINRNRI